MKIKILYILFVILFTLSCSKSSTSPDEINLLPPDNLQFENISLTSIRLFWQDVCEDEEGYIIEKIFMGEIIDSINLPKNSDEYVDEDMIHGRNYSYKVNSFYDSEFSSSRINLVNTFPIQILDLETTFIDSVTLKLTWDESYNFEHGFKIDKSVGWDNWENEIALLNENSVEWIDYNFNPEHHNVYRIYPYYDEYDGEKKGTSLTCPYPYPHSPPIEIFVVLSNFTVCLDYYQDEIQINWMTQSELDNIGWNIIRGESINSIWNNEVIVINEDSIAGAGTTNEPTDYDYYDNYLLEVGSTYYYWLENYNSTGQKRIYGPCSCAFVYEEVP